MLLGKNIYEVPLHGKADDMARVITLKAVTY